MCVVCVHLPGGAKGVNNLCGKALNVGKIHCSPQLQMEYLKQGNRRYPEPQTDEMDFINIPVWNSSRWAVAQPHKCGCSSSSSYINGLQVYNKLNAEDARPLSSPQITSSHLIFRQKHLYRHLTQILILLLNTEAQKPKRADSGRAFFHSKWSPWKRLRQDVQI